jgi:transposase-like protein
MSVWKAKAVRIARAARSSGWGRSHGLSRFRCKSYGRTFNALTNTPMAHLRKKERWLDHARAMIEGKSLAKTAQLCGVHPTTAFRWRHRFLRTPASDKPRMLRGIVEAGEAPSNSSPRCSLRRNKRAQRKLSECSTQRLNTQLKCNMNSTAERASE